MQNEVGRACGTNGRGERCVQGFGEKDRRKKPLDRPRLRWENGIKMDISEIGLVEVGVEWIHLAHDRDSWRAVGNAGMNLYVLAARNWSMRTTKN
jgi:hypothetical protein